jgi:uncharacterized membrane protein
MVKKILIALSLSSLILLQSCRHDSVGIENQPKVCFDEKIKPIFENNCNMSGCHGKNGEKYDFTTAKGILEAVSPYKPFESEAYNAITNSWDLMPPKPRLPLSKTQRTLIMVWISQGADTTHCQ